MSNFEIQQFAIPNHAELRLGKQGYETRFEIDTEHPLHNDPLVDPRESDFGFVDASSYYARPNNMTGEKLPGVPDAPLIRLDIANRLVVAERLLRTDPGVREALGAPARIKIDDAIRPYEVQQFAHDVAWPMIFRKVNPDITDDQIAIELPKYVAKPNPYSPHVAGASVDVALVNVETNEKLDRGHKGGAIRGTAYPDFHEGYHMHSGESDIEDVEGQAELAPPTSEIVLGRRVLYWAMSQAGLYVNPHEIWHYGRGDALSTYVAGGQRPYYGQAQLPEWYTSEMEKLSSDR